MLDLKLCIVELAYGRLHRILPQHKILNWLRINIIIRTFGPIASLACALEPRTCYYWPIRVWLKISFRLFSKDFGGFQNHNIYGGCRTWYDFGHNDVKIKSHSGLLILVCKFLHSSLTHSLLLNLTIVVRMLCIHHTALYFLCLVLSVLVIFCFR